MERFFVPTLGRRKFLRAAGLAAFAVKPLAAFAVGIPPNVRERVIVSALMPLPLKGRTLHVGWETHLTLPPHGEELAAFCRRFRLFEGGKELATVELAELIADFEFRSKSLSGNSTLVLTPEKPTHAGVHGKIRLGGYETTLVIVPRGGGSKAVRATAFEPLG